MQEIPSDESSPQTLSNLPVDFRTTFPSSEIFGVKLVNGRTTTAQIEIRNRHTAPITLQVMGGSLTTPIDTPGAPDPPMIVRNLTVQRYGVEIPATGEETLTYAINTEMHPQELRLNIMAVMQSEERVYTKMVFNETVSVVEAPMSFLDPQM